MKKTFVKAAIAALALVTIAFTGCAKKNADGSAKTTARSVEEIKKSGKVIIAVFSDKKPFGYVDENGEYQGYDVYFGNRIAQDLGVKAEYVPVEAASRVEYLVTGKVDIVLANFTDTKEREEKVDFALPYMKVALGVVSPESALITSPEQPQRQDHSSSAKAPPQKTYFTQNYPDVTLLKIPNQYSEALQRTSRRTPGAGTFPPTNTEVLAWALEKSGLQSRH